MRRTIFTLTLAVLLSAIVFGQTTEFTYQGNLSTGTPPGTPANSPHDFEFRLFAADSGGSALGTIQRLNVPVSNGAFSVKLDFGAQFTGAARYLEIAVRPAGGGVYTTLTPRQQVSTTPYSVRSLNSANADSATNSLQLGGVAADQYVLTGDPRMSDARPASSVNFATAVLSGVVPVANGGTGSSTQNFVDVATDQSNIGGNKTFTGTLTGNIVGAATQFNIGSQRILSAPAIGNLFAGVSAGGSNTTGNNNAFFGTQAGTENISGSNNSFFGRRSGTGSIAGSNNTMIGTGTSVSVGDISFATAIGAGASVGTNNTVVLGRNVDTVQVPGSLNVAGALSGSGAGLTNIPGTFIWQTVSGNAQQAVRNTGYLANNDGLVTITLPDSASLSMGDTVRVSGVGVGGWKIAQNAGQSIIVGAGINVSLPLPVWTGRESVKNWQAVASSADGSKLVAVARGAQIYTSTDSGVSWTPRESVRNWQSVASSSDGTKLVATVDGGQIYTSTDSGVSWTPRDSNRFWRAVASSADGTKLVAVAGGLFTSSNSGVTWSPQTVLGATNLQLVASSSDGTKLIAGTTGFASGKIYTSDNSGVTWTERAHGAFWQSLASSADGTKLFAGIDPGPIYVSTDSGVSWVAREYNRNWYSIAASADGSKAVAANYGYGIYYSLDTGTNWTVISPDARSWLSVAVSADGSKVIAAAQNGLLYTTQIPANLGRATTVGPTGFLAGGQFTSIDLQYIGNGQFLALNAVGGPFQGN